MTIPSGLSALVPSLAEFPSSMPATTSTAQSSPTFGDLLKGAIGNVDGLQSTADSHIGNLLQGAPNTDVGNVMVSVEKADVAFQLMMQVRNKVVSAYQDIEKMQF